MSGIHRAELLEGIQNVNCIGPVRMCSSDLDSRLRGNDMSCFLSRSTKTCHTLSGVEGCSEVAG